MASFSATGVPCVESEVLRHGRYDLCAMLSTESTHQLDTVIERMRAIKSVVDTFSTMLLATKLERPE